MYEWLDLNSLHAEIFFMLLLSSASTFQKILSEVLINDCQSVKQFGSRSGLTSVGPDLGPNSLKKGFSR